MSKKRDWTGVTQGELTVLRESGKDKHGNLLWECRCSCGATVEKSNKDLGSGTSSCSPACGVAASNRRRAVHNMHKTKVYAVWTGMRNRCSSPSAVSYHRYGGRGITVCDRWESFDNFLSDMGEPLPGQTLDRIDNNKGYEPGNCRWATRKEQANNRSTSVFVEHEGLRLSLPEWAGRLGISDQRLRARYADGIRPPELFKPDLKLGRPATSVAVFEGAVLSLKEIAAKTGVPYSTVVWRHKHNRNLVTGKHDS